jgi:hypothetical protein
VLRARWPDMPQVRLLLPSALKNHNIRRACCAVEAILRSADILDQMPPVALEQIRDYCSDYVKGRKGKDAFSEFKTAYIHMVVEHLDNARKMERMTYTGITGRDWIDEPGEDQTDKH